MHMASGLGSRPSPRRSWAQEQEAFGGRGREVAAPLMLPPKRLCFWRNLVGLVTRASLRNEIITIHIFTLTDVYKTWLPLPSDGLCPKRKYWNVWVFFCLRWTFVKCGYFCWPYCQEIRNQNIQSGTCENPCTSGGKCPSSWESLHLGTSELSWSPALCSFPDTVHLSQHSRWDNSKRTYYDQWWHPAENQVLHGRPLSLSLLCSSCIKRLKTNCAEI